ncbi:response regulator transcription factor [Marinitoga lauensis]|uniref:response regulator transcription factor n=1 Tax=Marinitoga lauensis TaxID=2201189 RepID=UPI0010110BC9|nr:response regulator transcription factor [Marinitoga lauensis]
MKILVIEDEKSILDLIKMNLILEGFDVVEAEAGEKGLKVFKKENPDLVVLDLMLPDIDGFDVLKKIQEISYKTPIIILTAKNSQNDKLLGLELGADDYITKPFDSKELILRIRNILKRIKKQGLSNNELIIGELKLKKDSRTMYLRSKEIYLTKKEFEVMEFLMNNYNQVVKREILLEKIWGFDSEIDTRAVDMAIQRLRKKIKESNVQIRSLYGIGYKLEVKDEK